MPLEQAKQLILKAKNISIIPSQTNEPESLTAALALFYTLKELRKNVNLIVEGFPEKIKFLTPSVDFISTPKNFVISIPKNVADVSQIYYEKNEEHLKIHLSTEKGTLKKEQISFYYAEAKPDLVITVGIRDFKKELENTLDSFGFLLGSPILNIDTANSPVENKKFGSVNLLEDKSISEITASLIKSVDEKLIVKNSADCLLSGLILYYENFQSQKTNPGIFKMSSELMEKGADYHAIVHNLNGTTKKVI